MSDMLLLLLLLMKCYREEQHVESLLLKQKWENVPNRFGRWFKRRTWLEEQVLLYTIWIGNSKILNMPESAEMPKCGQIFLHNCNKNCNFVDLPEYAWNQGRLIRRNDFSECFYYKVFMTSIYSIISIEIRLVTHFSGYEIITLH